MPPPDDGPERHAPGRSSKSISAAIVANWRLFGSCIRPGPAAGVVKADGYGLGALHVAPALHAAGCRHFFVALLDEALVIRDLAPGRCCRAGWPDSGANRDYLVMTLCRYLARWQRSKRGPSRHGRSVANCRLSSMSIPVCRGLVLATRTRSAAAGPFAAEGFTLSYMMTHLVSSEFQDDPLNKLQLKRFDDACAGLPRAPRSMLNSSGMFLGPRLPSTWHARVQRLRHQSYPRAVNPMTLPVRLTARVLAVREIRHVPRSATMPFGGAGLPADRHCGDWLCRWAGIAACPTAAARLFDGPPVPLVGRVSMDLTTFDVTTAPRVVPGDLAGA